MPILRKEGYVRTNNSDADFRAWVQFIHDVFALGGWVQTADTGQIDLVTVTVPTLSHDKQGYEMWRMDDTLQATYPVYVRIDYGSAGSAVTTGMWINIGTGSDGAGNLTNLRFSSPIEVTSSNALISGTSSGTTANNTVFGSADTYRIAIALFFDNLWSGGASTGPMFGIERTLSLDGIPTNEGVFVAWAPAGNGQLARNKLVRLSEPSPPTMVNYFAYILGAGLSPTVFTSTVGVGVVFPMAGGVAQTPCRNWLAVSLTDWQPESEFNLFDRSCDADVRYRVLGGNNIQPLSAAGLAMRWD